MTSQELGNLREAARVLATGRPRSKYGAVRSVDADGRKWDSNAERKRYSLLCEWEKLGIIRKLERQPKFEIHAVTSDGDRKCVAKYLADFRYEMMYPGYVETVIEDVKSKPTRTATYRLKKKLVEWQYGITITEVR